MNIVDSKTTLSRVRPLLSKTTLRVLQIVKLLFIIALFVGVVVVMYFLRIPILSLNIWSASIYGLILVLYSGAQYVMALLNFNFQKKKLLSEGNEYIDTVTLVVGYREDAEYFRKCLVSVLKTSSKAIVVVDGNDPDDMYMKDIFDDVFKNMSKKSLVVKEMPTAKTIRKLLLDTPAVITTETTETNYICVLQPHNGKRHVLYTGFLIAETMPDAQFLLATDSDTILHDDAVSVLRRSFWDSKTGAVTGDVRIFNRFDSVISVLSYIRYWFAGNIERGAQSYVGCVTCVSGPLGMYRIKVLNEIRDEWLNQTFMGQECSFGDDRHLTTCTLSKGYNVHFQPLAHCSTETPTNLLRFYKQQTRWIKSSLRERSFSFRWILDRPLWLTVEMAYQIFYPLLLSGVLVNVLFVETITKPLSWDLVFYLAVSSILMFVKSLSAAVSERNPLYLLFWLYPFIYIFLLIPARLEAVILFKDISWGTSARSSGEIAKSTIDAKVVFPALWTTALMSGVGIGIWNGFKNGRYWQVLSLISEISFVTIFFLAMWATVTARKNALKNNALKNNALKNNTLKNNTLKNNTLKNNTLKKSIKIPPRNSPANSPKNSSDIQNSR